MSGAERQRRYRLAKGGLVSIELLPSEAETLRRLRQRTGSKTSEVVARALALLEREVARTRSSSTKAVRRESGAAEDKAIKGSNVARLGQNPSPGDDVISAAAAENPAQLSPGPGAPKARRPVKKAAKRSDDRQSSFDV